MDFELLGAKIDDVFFGDDLVLSGLRGIERSLVRFRNIKKIKGIIPQPGMELLCVEREDAANDTFHILYRDMMETTDIIADGYSSSIRA